MAEFGPDSGVRRPLDSTEPTPPPDDPDAHPESGSRGVRLWVGVVAAVLLAGGAGYWFLLRAPEPPPEPPPVIEPIPEPVVAVPEEPPPPPLPTLDESDALMRNLLRALTSHPEALNWLLTDEIARRVAIATDNVADGVSPRSALRTLAPGRDYRVLRTENGFEVDPSNHARYDGLATVIAEADMAAVAATLDRVMPLLEEAYAELGRPDRGYAQALLAALERLMAAPIPETPIRLRAQVMRYEYLEPAIEGLDPASKHLIRFGPDNQRRIQDALAPLVEYLRLRTQQPG